MDRINDFLRQELASVDGYQKALRTLKKKADADGEHILQLAADHQRTVTALHGFLEARGGTPPDEAEPGTVPSVAALAVDVVSARLDDRAFVVALLSLEQRGLDDYEKALSSLDADARELVEFELIPRERKHVAGLSQRLLLLAS